MLPRLIAALQAAVFTDSPHALAEKVGVEPTSLLQRHFSKVVAYQLAYFSMAEAARVERARLLQRLASNKVGLPMPNASIKIGGDGVNRTPGPFPGSCFQGRLASQLQSSPGGGCASRTRKAFQPARFRNEWTCRCTKPSMVPTARIERATSTYEEDVMPFHYAGEYWSRLADSHCRLEGTSFGSCC